jgi:hypothetical protein
VRSLWIGGIVLVALTVTGCSTAGQSVTTTSKSTSVHTPTTVGSTTSTPGPKDKLACSKFATYQLAVSAGKKPSSAAVRRALSRAENPKLRHEVAYWEHALLAKKTSKVSHDLHTITVICAKIDKSTTTVTTP